MTKETVGKVALELLKKEPETRNPIEQMRESLTDFDKNIHLCIERYKQKFLGNFYVVVITKKERLMPNVLRNYFTGRITCPTPDYDQAVYRYDKAEDSITFLWVIPSKDTCHLLHANAMQVHPSERDLLKYVLKFIDGSLLKYSKKLNGEQIDSILVMENI